MTNFVELRKGEVSRMHHAPTSGSVNLHSWVTTLGQQGTEVQGGRSSTLGCMSPCALLTLRFSETEASPGKYPATPARARGSACGRGVAALSAGLAAQICREVSGEVWRRTPQLVYRLVYKGLGALAGASPVLQLSCKWWKNKRADERTRTADLLQLRVIIHVLQGLAEGCNSRLSKPISLLRVAACCTVLRSRWCQSGVRNPCITSRQSRCKC
jgi:hypothetical protein